MLLRPILLPTHTFLLLFLPIQSLPCAPSCGQPMLPHKESILSPALSSHRKAWITAPTVQGAKGVFQRLLWCGCWFSSKYYIGFLFQTSGAESWVHYTPPFKTWLLSKSRKALLDLVCSFTLQVPTLSPTPPLRPILMCLIYVLEWMASIGISRSTLHFSWPSSGTLEAHL